MTEKYSQKKLLSNTCIKQYKVKVTVVISLGKIRENVWPCRYLNLDTIENTYRMWNIDSNSQTVLVERVTLKQ